MYLSKPFDIQHREVGARGVRPPRTFLRRRAGSRLLLGARPAPWSRPCGKGRLSVQERGRAWLWPVQGRARGSTSQVAGLCRGVVAASFRYYKRCHGHSCPQSSSSLGWGAGSIRPSEAQAWERGPAWADSEEQPPSSSPLAASLLPAPTQVKTSFWDTGGHHIICNTGKRY